jgi:hypothetical protein
LFLGLRVVINVKIDLKKAVELWLGVELIRDEFDSLKSAAEF